MIVCATYLDGEYGVKDITIGVPVIIGKTVSNVLSNLI